MFQTLRDQGSRKELSALRTQSALFPLHLLHSPVVLVSKKTKTILIANLVIDPTFEVPRSCKMTRPTRDECDKDDTAENSQL